MIVITHFIFLATLITLSAPLEASFCPVVKCQEPRKTDGTCFEKMEENVYQYISCSSNQHCPAYGISDVTKKCIPKEERLLSNQVDGEECYKNENCSSKICDKNVCVGKKENESCVNTGQCAKGLYCQTSASKCFPQEKEREICESDNDCINNAGCSNNKRCMLYYSLDAGESSPNARFCKSGFISDDLKCTLLKSLESSLECKPDQTTCKYEASFGTFADPRTITKSCVCSYGSTDKKYCPLDSEHKLTTELVDLRKKYYNGQEIMNLHSFRRHQSNDKKTYSRIKEIDSFPKFYNAEKCALDFELGWESNNSMIGLSLLAFICLFIL